MKNSIKILSLCVVMMVVFAVVSFAKTTDTTQFQKNNQSVLLKKAMRDGISVKDITGKTHYIGSNIFKVGCSNSDKTKNKRGPFECLFMIMIFVNDIHNMSMACADSNSNYVSQECIDAIDEVINQMDNVAIACEYLVSEQIKSSKAYDKLAYLKSINPSANKSRKLT